MYKPDYDNSLVNLSNSILKHFNVKPLHNTVPEIDKIMENKRHVVVFLFDGMGQYIINTHLKEDGLFRQNVATTITSTFPPTTVAATSAFLSAEYPIESGWLGWVQYFKNIDANVKVFKNINTVTKEHMPLPLLLEEVSPYTSIIKRINEGNNKEIAHMLQGAPLDPSFSSKYLSLFVKKAFKTVKKEDEGFVYAYWNKPDKILHEKGVYHHKSKRYVKKIERVIKRYAKKNKDVLTIIIADHGFHDVTYLSLDDYPDLKDCCIRPFSLEGRACNFFIKEDRKEEFETLFNKYLGDKFELYSKENYIRDGLFGKKVPNEVVDGFLGDFVAVAIKEYSLEYKTGFSHLKAHHAGGTKEEMLVDVIAINK